MNKMSQESALCMEAGNLGLEHFVAISVSHYQNLTVPSADVLRPVLRPLTRLILEMDELESCKSLEEWVR